MNPALTRQAEPGGISAPVFRVAGAVFFLASTLLGLAFTQIGAQGRRAARGAVFFVLPRGRARPALIFHRFIHGPQMSVSAPNCQATDKRA